MCAPAACLRLDGSGFNSPTEASRSTIGCGGMEKPTGATTPAELAGAPTMIENETTRQDGCGNEQNTTDALLTNEQKIALLRIGAYLVTLAISLAAVGAAGVA